jgi:hypothetical protein
MTEPAISLERSKATVPNAPTGQTSLSLWPDRDPNLYRVGIYEFKIGANKLKKLSVTRPSRGGRRRSSSLRYQALH